MKEKVTRNMCILKSILEVFPGTSYCMRHGNQSNGVCRSRIRVVCSNLHPRLFFFRSVPLDFGRAAAKRSDRWIRAPGAPEARFARGFWPASTGRSAWTALRAARSRQSWFGLRVAVGAHTQGLRRRSKAEQHTDGRVG